VRENFSLRRKKKGDGGRDKKGKMPGIGKNWKGGDAARAVQEEGGRGREPEKMKEAITSLQENF